MLEPDSRSMLRELLRPPAGFLFDRAITTTFSLDLMALLTMPVAFSMFDRSDTDGGHPDPLALLQAIRQYSGRIHVFCEAGRIAVPKRHHLLFAHLERSVIEVSPPNEHGVFHPKLTVLRFVASEDTLPADPPSHAIAEPRVKYRLLCGSRNLTFDRSWDTMLVLEGKLAAQRRNGFTQCRPLGQFVESLPGLALREIDSEAAADCRWIAEELRRVEFKLPDGFEELAFWALGLKESPLWPFPEDVDRMLVVSPFLSKDLLSSFEGRKQRPILVSRQDALDELPEETVERFDAYILHSAAEEPTRQIDEEDTEGKADDAVESGHTGEGGVSEEITGLHAKVYVADRGGQTHIWTGSANATRAAFSRNIEFLVELRGPRRRFGVTNLVRSEEDRDEAETKALHFDDLLDPYRRPVEPIEVNPDAREAERLADQSRRLIAQAGLVVDVEPFEGDEGEEQFRLLICRLSGKGGAVLDGKISARCLPIRLPAHRAAPLAEALGSQGAVFTPVSFEAISAFVAFEVKARVGRVTHKVSFVLNLPLRGVLEDRNQRLLTALLASREQLLRYLLMLLAEDEHDFRVLVEALDGAGGAGPRDQGNAEIELPLLEPLLKTLAQQPERIDEIARLIDDLACNPQGRMLLPENFAEMWEPIWDARKEMTT